MNFAMSTFVPLLKASASASKFSFLVSKSCFAHYVLLALLFVICDAIYLGCFVLKDRKNSFIALGVCGGAAVLSIATFFIFSSCVYCTVFAILFVLAVLAGGVLFARKLIVKKEKVAKETVVEDTVAEEPAPAEEAAPAEEPASVEEVAEEVAPVEEPAPVQEAMSLEEAFSAAENTVAMDDFDLSKKSISEWLVATFGNDIEVNCRANYTKTGLPLADTHYAFKNGKRICFIYVYEMSNNKTFFLLKADTDTAAEIRAKHPGFVPSKFPHSAQNNWYTLIVDSTFESTADVLDVISLAFTRLSDKETVKVVRKTVESVDINAARELVTDDEVKTMVAEASEQKELFGEHGKQEIVNIDTLSNVFEDGAEINIAALKEKKLVSKNAKQVKILARGVLTKKFTVYADAYSADAAKMILATGGTLIVLKKQ